MYSPLIELREGYSMNIKKEKPKIRTKRMEI